MSETMFLVVGGALIVFLIGLAIWQARRVSARIEEYRRQEERQIKRNPYAQMAALAELTEKNHEKKPPRP